MGWSLNPPRGIFCWEDVKMEQVAAFVEKVSIPLGGFFVGKPINGLMGYDI